jgi:hypothetical protein
MLVGGKMKFLFEEDPKKLSTKDLIETVADEQIVFVLDDGVTANYQRFKGVVAEIK